MSKNFDAWMSHNEQRYAATSAPSPRGDDGMSYVSKKKHEDYANVVMEMKSQKFNFNQRVDFDDFDDAFGFSSPHQQQQQQMGWPQSRQPSPSAWGSNQFQTNNFQQPSQQQRQQYHDDGWGSSTTPVAFTNSSSAQRSIVRPRGRDDGIGTQMKSSQPKRQGRTLYREHNNTNGASHQRSKSSIRRNAERTQALAKLNTDDDDVASDVWSSFEGAGGATWAAAGSRLASSGQRHQQQQQQPQHSQRRQQQQPQQRQAPRRLDSYGSNNTFQSPSLSTSDDVSNSGSTGAARRRRVKSAADGKQQQQYQHQNQAIKPIALAPPPSSSTASTASVSSSAGARRNMRMRMQTKSATTPSTAAAEVPVASNTSVPNQQLQSQLQSVSSSSSTSKFERSSSVASMDSSEIDNEVNMAMSELKLSGVDIDIFNNTNHNNSSLSPPKKGRTSPMTVGTKSLTLDSSTIISSKGYKVSKGLVLSNTISVDQHSESSSLTNDTSDWQGAGNNMFKDAKGSTFHKSKRIVRPNELEGVNSQQSQQQEQQQPRSPSVKDRISQYKTATKTSVGAPQLPSSSLSDSPPNKLAQILMNASVEPSLEQQEQSPPLLSLKVNRVTNSPFRQKDKVVSDSKGGKGTAISEPSPTSPFAVKLRKSTEDSTSPMKSREASSPIPSGGVADIQQKNNVEGEVSPNPFLSQSKLRKTGLPLTNNQPQKSTDENDEPEPPRKDVASLIKERIAAANKQQSQNAEASSQSDEPRANFNSLRENFKRETSPQRSSPVNREESVSAQQEEPTPDPRAALMAMLKKRANPEAEEPEKSDAKQALSNMLASRAPNGAQTAKKESANSGLPSLKDDPKYAKYMQMLKVGMPLPVVQHAMTRDGLDPAILEGDHNKPVQETPVGVPLKEDPAYAKYFKMLKLGLPMGAVKNAMERDGVDSAVMDGDHNAPVSASKPNASSAKKKEKDTHRRTRLHWETLREVNSNSVWAALADDEEMEQIEIDEAEFTNLFQAEIKSTPTAAQSSNSGSSSRNAVQVIDPKRANNGGIILARLRMSYDDMAKVVDNVDESKMTANQVQGIIEYMPTPTERKSLRDYMKSGRGGPEEKFENLCECEKFMVAMISVKQSRMKLRALLFKLQFRGCIQDLAHDVFSVEKACDELSNSVKLRKLFGIVLNVGNRLNTAGPSDKRKASAFSIQSLLKLNQAKAFDNKTTFLQYVVLVVQRNNEKLLNFKDDLPTVAKADKIYWDQCINELEEMETQLEIVRKLALHEANSKKNIYALPKKKGAQDDYDSDNLNIDEDMSLEEEVSLLRSTRIGMFALGAIKKVSQLRERVDIAKDKFSRLLEYFGEDGDNSKMDVHVLFAIINTFCRDFEVAREVVSKQEEAKKRAEKKESSITNKKLKTIEESSPPIKTPALLKASSPPPIKKPALLKASSLQPNMSNVLAEMQQKRIIKSVPPTISDFPDDESNIPEEKTLSVEEHQLEREKNEMEQQARVEQQLEREKIERERQALEQQLEREKIERERQALEQQARVAEEQRHEQERIERERYDMEQQARVADEQQRLERERIELQRYAEQQAREVAAAKKHAEEEQQRLQKERLERERYAMEENGVEVEFQSSHDESKPQLSPKETRPQTRREILARRRHARFSSAPQTSPVAPSAAQPSSVTPPRTEKSKAETTTQKQTVPQSSSNATARAAARDRYSRHKKIISQQRQHSTDTTDTRQNNEDQRRFAC